MNLSSNTGRNQQGANRKVKRLIDINALESARTANNQYLAKNLTQESFQNNAEIIENNSGISSDNSNIFSNMKINADDLYISQPQSVDAINALRPQKRIYPTQNLAQVSANIKQQQDMPSFPTKMSMFEQPIVQDMAMEYGQKLADQGKQIMENHFEKWIPVTRLKYYFAVDNRYVINKIRLLFFPFTHKDWSLKFDQENAVQPRYDINALDLYIPTMAYITYVVLAGLMLGMQNRFSPEQLGIQASSALAYTIFETWLYTITLYVANIPTNLKTLDLLAFSGYKFVIMVACVSSSIIFYKSGYYVTLVYTCLSFGFFLFRTLRTKISNYANGQTAPADGLNYDPYGTSQPANQFDYSIRRKKKLYLLFLIIGIQTCLTFWLSKHLVLHGLVAFGIKIPDYAIKVANINDDKHLEYTLSKILIPRVVGSTGHKKVQDFLINELESYGLTIETDRFTERTPNFGNLTFTNIIGKYNPDADEYLALACHYDSKYFANNPNFVGAIDSAVPCAIMLNVAKIIIPQLKNLKQKTNLGILFVFFDGEEAFHEWTDKDSVYGSRHLANKMSKKVTSVRGTNDVKSDIDRIEVLVLLDLIGARNSKFRNFFPNTEPLHSLLVNIERNLSDEKLLEGKNFQFLASYSDNFVDDDHRPFLQKNVPILHLISTPFPKQWHKPSDTAANLHWPSIRNFNKIFRLFTYIFVAVHDENVNFRLNGYNW